MKPDILVEAAILALKQGLVFLVTTDADGWPHLAVAGKAGLTPEKHLALEEWYCPRTMANMRANPRIAVVIWDPEADQGYQLLGEMEEVRDLGIVAGYNGGEEGDPTVPMVERQLIVHIDRAMVFRRGPHLDAEVPVSLIGALNGDGEKDKKRNRGPGGRG